MKHSRFAGSIAALVIALGFVGGCRASQKEVGQACTSDSDCRGGVCLDLSTVQANCTGRICTQPCQANGDCPAVAAEPDCDPVRGRRLCLYGAWERQYCARR